METPLSTITFFAKAQTYYGQRLVIFGNTPELGDGDINKGIKMENNQGPFNHKLTVAFNSNPTGRWYKYAIVEESSKSIIYEQIPDRNIPNFMNTVCLRDTFNAMPVVQSVIVNIRVPYVTEYGQNIFLLGDTPELGNWDINSAFPLRYIDREFWGGSLILPISKEERTFHYKCFIRNDRTQGVTWENGEDHTFTISPTENPSIFQIIDPFRWSDSVTEGISTLPFTEVFNQRKKSQKKVVLQTNEEPDTVTIKFSILCPAPKQGQTMKIAGSCGELGWWAPDRALVLSDNEFPTWTAVTKISRKSLPFEYKYIMCDPFGTVIWESRANRFLKPADVPGVDSSFPVSLFCHDWIPSIYTKPQRGLCLRIDLPNVWTKKSCGCGQFGDICRVVDFCGKVGAAMIQISPVYDENSAFALDPVYIDLLNIPDIPDDVRTMVSNYQADQQEELFVDIQDTRSFKIAALKKIFKRSQKSLAFDEFVSKNADWLARWQKYNANEDPEFIAWVQFVADQQLSQVHDYAKANYVALRGEIPFTVQIASCDAKMYPKVFTGFVEVEGEKKLGTASFAWNNETKEWWSKRMQRHSHFFQSVKIDSIDHIIQVGECPPNMSVSTAHLQQDKSFTKQELKNMKLWDIARYTKPYLRAKLLSSYFGDNAAYVESKYFKVRGTGPRDKLLSFKCQSIEEVEPKFRQNIERMLSDVILTESLGNYFTVNQLGISWLELPEPQKTILQILSKQTSSEDKPIEFLINDSRGKVRQITQNGTGIEIIGDDGNYHFEMKQESEQLKQRWLRFTDTRNLPFGCVSVIGSNIQEWWRSNREEAEKYWHEELWRSEECPLELPQWALECIIRMHIWCGAQWVVIALDDIASLSLANYGLPKPGGKSTYPLENLSDDHGLIAKIEAIIRDSGRRIEF